MSLQSQWNRAMSQRLNIAHAVWPPFVLPVAIGDVGTWGPSRGFHRGFGNPGVDLNKFDLRVGPPTDLEISAGATMSGNLKPSYKQITESGVVEVNGSVSFNNENSFYLYAPQAVTYEIGDVEGFAEAIRKASNSKITIADHGIYRLAVVKTGMFLGSMSAGVTATVKGSWSSPGSQSAGADLQVGWSGTAGIHQSLNGSTPTAFGYGMWRYKPRGIKVDPLA